MPMTRMPCCTQWPLSRCLSVGLSLWLLALPLTQLANLPCHAEALKGNIIKTETEANTGQVNPDQLVTVQEGDLLEMKISTVIESGLSTEGDEFFGKLSRDYTVGGKVVLPRGTIVHGVVDEMTEAKWAGRNGHIAMKLDYLITPDGREIPIEGTSTTRDNKAVAALKVAGRTVGYTAVGGAIGAIMALKIGGVALAAASEGYLLAGGAAVGGAVGLGAALASKGMSAHIPEGAELKIKLQEGLQLPTMEMPQARVDDVKLEGLNVSIMNVLVKKDPFGERREMVLTLDISNQTKYAFSTFDLALMDEYGSVHYASPFGETGLWFQRLAPNSRMRGAMSFTVDDPTLQHYLVFYQQYTRQPLAKIAIDATDPVELEGKGKRRKRGG